MFDDGFLLVAESLGQILHQLLKGADPCVQFLSTLRGQHIVPLGVIQMYLDAVLMLLRCTICNLIIICKYKKEKESKKTKEKQRTRKDKRKNLRIGVE